MAEELVQENKGWSKMTAVYRVMVAIFLPDIRPYILAVSLLCVGTGSHPFALFLNFDYFLTEECYLTPSPILLC